MEEASIESLAMGWNNLLLTSASSADAIVDQNNESADFVDIFRELGNIVDGKTLQYSEDWLSEDGIKIKLNQNQTEVDPDSDVEQTQDVSPSQACNALGVVLEWYGTNSPDHTLC